jgi:hypothetical protein
MTLRKELTTASAAMICAVAAVLLLWPPRSMAQSAVDLQVRFVGFTNTALGTAALFQTTNGTMAEMTYFVSSLETKSSDNWVTNLPPAARNWNSSFPAEPWWMFVGSLQPGVAHIHRVALPATNTTWRLRIMCIEKARGIAGAVQKIEDKVDKIRTGSDAQRFGGRQYFVVTPELTK